MMNERERLIELLNDWGNKENDGVRAESIADYLLENGVVVLPCKVGDKVYYASKDAVSLAVKSDVVYKAEVVRMTHTMLGLTIIVRMKIEDGYAEIAYVRFGKDIFLTKEEAEQALKGGNENE